LPKEFVKYLNYCRSLNFEDKPCINDLKRLFKKLLAKKGLEVDGKFDWITKKAKIPQEIEFEEQEEEPDYKKKLKDILGK
jgi:RNAse (barnase) inhibitor barstar